MEYFLENIAKSVHREFGNSLNRHCLVFPNRRAGLYFLKYLASMISKPVWTPAIYTINDLFRSCSSLQPASPELLLFELYKVYRRVKKSPESFDEFYFWGDMLLDDFDDIDKYLVDAKILFSNVLDLKTIDRQFGGLTEAQIEIVKRFWVNFEPDRPSREKTGFIDIWSVLHDIYTEFRSALLEQQLAYEGMIFRDLAANKGDDFFASFEWDMVHFIGFNALNECEKVVMRKFRKAGKARFYWDYDDSYINQGKLSSAGYFMRDNLKIFGNDMPSDWNYKTMLSAERQSVRRRVIEASSDVAQVKLIPDLLGQIPDLTEETAHHTAVVLADENLLMPVLTSLPPNAGDINITMGYPLRQTPVYSFLRHLMDLQRNASSSGGSLRFGYADVLSILRHPMSGGLLTENDRRIAGEITATNMLWVPAARFADSEYLSMIFAKPGSPAELSAYFKDILTVTGSVNSESRQEDDESGMARNIRNEFIYRIVLSINRLEAIIGKGDVVFSTETCMRILDKMLRMQSVPFSGEPLSGIQIMGILETRALDFRNLVILSVNEGVLPSVSTGSSFIPFSLREAFGLPSINHQESIYAYHFYRLLQRAQNVTFLYNSNSDGLRTGEMSRFLIQMKYDELLKPEFLNLSFEIKSHGTVPEMVERTAEHVRLLRSRFADTDGKRLLSPSAINTWLNCRMRFYYRYVNGLKEPEVVSGDIDPAMVGEIVHDIMRSLYADFTGKMVDAGSIDLIIRNKPLLETVIISSINNIFSGGSDRKIEGTEFIIRDVLMAYVLKILRTDRAIAPFRILHLESEFRFPVSVMAGEEELKVLTGGIIDRIDNLGGKVRIVDYKTGSVSEKPTSVEELFADDRKKDLDAWLQTLLYCEAYLNTNKNAAVRPSVYRVRKLGSIPEGDMLHIRTETKEDCIVEDYSIVREEYMRDLKAVISKILGNDEPFVMTEDIRNKCSWCPYRGLCTR